MKKYKIFIDSLCSMPVDIANKLDITKLQYSISDNDGKLIVDDFSDELVDRITTEIANKHPYKTGLLQPTIIEEHIKQSLEEYEQVIYICSSNSYTGQYKATQYLQNEFPERVFIVNSNSICTINEEIAWSIIEYFKEHDTINQEVIDKIVKDINATGTTIFIPKNIDGLLFSGRIPNSLVKLLKLARVTPIIKAEEKNTACKIIKSKNASDIPKLLTTVDDLFKKKLNAETIKKVYVIHTLISKENIAKAVEEVQKYYGIDKEKIIVRSNPLPIATYTLKDSIGLGVYTNNIPKKN